MKTSHVVVVPAGVNVLDFGSAARTYWTLKYVGVKDVSILDGGLAAWRQAGLPIESGVKAPSPKIFTATVDNSILALANDVEAIEGKGGATLVDARPASFFLGKEKAPALAGLWPHSRRGEPRQRQILRSANQPAEAEG